MEHAKRNPEFFKGLLFLSADGLVERYRNDHAFIDTVLTLAAGRDPRFEALSQTEEELPAPENFSKEGWRKAVEFEAYCRGLFSKKYFEIVMFAKDLQGEGAESVNRFYCPEYMIECKPTRRGLALSANAARTCRKTIRPSNGPARGVSSSTWSSKRMRTSRSSS